MMIMCSNCHKRPAVVFLSPTGNMKDSRGLCLVCAKKLGIKPVNDLLNQMGVTDDQLEAMENELGEILNNNQDSEPNPDAGDNPDDMNALSGFVPGGAATMPFLQNIQNSYPNAGDGQGQKPETGGATSVHEAQTRHKTKRRHLNAYCTDLTAKARAGAIDAVVGREKEIERVIQILCRRTKNNPCLIGEPGVGKTAVAEGLAIRIAEGNVPFVLKKKEIHLLDLTALVAGTQFRGQFESRIKGLLDEIKAEGNIILFIDEVHNLVGTGDAEGSMNAANILKPALSRGEIQVIGATTFEEYRKYIEKDAA